eukprot:m51a1_g12273 putative adenylate guanylate cyclase catalytic domain protein (751) ;mRNA; f:219556-222260
MPRIHVSAGATTAGISLATSLVLAAVVITPFALLSTRFALGQIERIIDMQLDLHVATVEATADTQLRAVAGHYATLVHSGLLPAARDSDTMAALYWGYKEQQRYLSWLCFFFPEDHGHFVAVFNDALEGVLLSHGIRTVDNASSAALAQRLHPAETDSGKRVAFTLQRNYTLPTSALLAGQLVAPTTHKIQASITTGELGIVYTVRLCADGNPCAQGEPDQAGILQIVATSADMSSNLRDSLSDGADSSARAFVTDGDGRLIAVSHGSPWVSVNGRLQYLMCSNRSVGDPELATIGKDLVDAGKVGKEIHMHRTSTHIVSSKSIAVGNAGTVWTIYYAVPTQAVYGDLNRTVGICVGIAGSLALFAAFASWSVQHLFLTMPLNGAVKTINTLARLNMRGIAEVTNTPPAIEAKPAERQIAQTESSAPCRRRRRYTAQVPATGSFLAEVSGVLQAADKMVHSLYCVGRYVSMDLATWVIGKGVVSSPLQPRDVSVLFCDIEGSTAMIDRCRAEDTMAEFAEMLNEILTNLANTAKHYGGYIDKFIGDEVMVVFNAPCECPQHEGRACEAAVAMQQCIQRLRGEWESSGKYKSFTCPRVRVSVASGTVLVGDIGAFGTLVNYTAIGEVVCIAARLQEVAKTLKPPSGILLTGETWDAAVLAGSASLVTDDSHTSAIVGHSESLSAELRTNGFHFQRAMHALAQGDCRKCVEVLAQDVDASYLPAAANKMVHSLYCVGHYVSIDLGTWVIDKA